MLQFNAEIRAMLFMSNIRQRVALRDAEQDARRSILRASAKITPLPPARPAWLLMPGQKAKKAVYRPSWILFPGQEIVSL